MEIEYASEAQVALLQKLKWTGNYQNLTKAQAHAEISGIIGDKPQAPSPAPVQQMPLAIPHEAVPPKKEERYKLTDGNIRSNALSSALEHINNTPEVLDLWHVVKVFENYIRNGVMPNGNNQV